MTAKRARLNAEPVSDLIARVIDPILARRAGMTTALVQAWDEIVGERIGACSRPERIRWTCRATSEEPFEPATLIIACDSSAALIVQHMADQIVERVNAFLGFAAVARVRIVQKPVAAVPVPVRPRRILADGERDRIAARVAAVDDAALREALLRLGESVASTRRR